MATITTGQIAAFSNGSSTDTGWVGYSYATPRVIRYAFTVPASGCTSLSVSGIQASRGASSNPSASDLASVRFYIGTNPNSHVNAHGSGYAYTGSLRYDGFNSSTGRDTFSLSTNINLLAGTYYLFIFPGYTSNNVYFNFTYASGVNVTLTLTSGGSYVAVTLTLSQGVGTQLSVAKGGVPITSGATVYTGDALTVTYSAETGYTNAACTAGGASVASGGTVTVGTTDLTVATTAVPAPYTLSLQPGTGTLISVSRTDSPIGGGASGILDDGDTIYYNDVLEIAFSPQTGYTVTATAVTGATQSGGRYVAGANNVSASAAAVPTEHRLTISADTGAIISIIRTGSPIGGAPVNVELSTGDPVYYNDALTLSFSAETGYDLGVCRANGVVVQSGSYSAPDDDLLISAAATVQQFLLDLTTNTGAIITVTRTSSPKQGAARGPLVDGDTVYYSDVLTVAFSAETGYAITEKTINGSAAAASSVSHTVTGAVNAVAVAAVRSFRLTLSAGTGAVIEVERLSSPKQGAPSGALADGDTVYYSDELSVVFYAESGYTLATKMINNVIVQASANHTVTGAVNCSASATLNRYRLSITKSPSGVTVTVVRTSSPLNPSAPIGQLNDGSEVYYGDALTVTYALGVGYELEEHTIDGEDFDSGDRFYADGDTVVVVLASAAGFVYINNEPYLVYIGNGSSYDRYLSYIGNGSSYEPH